MFGADPGPCPVCGAAHTACTRDSGPVVVVQLPMRDGLAALSPELQPAPLLEAERIQAGLPPGEFTTGTFRRKKP